MRANNKVFPYVVVLKQKNRRSVETIGLIAGFIFVMLMLKRVLAWNYWYIDLPITAVGAGLLAYNFNLFRTRRKTQLTPLLLVAGLTLSLDTNTAIFGIAFLALALLSRAALRPQEIGFSDDEIVFSGLIPRKQSWDELSNVLIKDGLLTMDYKNNRLFQKETDDLDDDEDDEVTEEEFNAFCRIHLKP